MALVVSTAEAFLVGDQTFIRVRCSDDAPSDTTEWTFNDTTLGVAIPKVMTLMVARYLADVNVGPPSYGSVKGAGGGGTNLGDIGSSDDTAATFINNQSRLLLHLPTNDLYILPNAVAGVTSLEAELLFLVGAIGGSA